MLLPIIYDEGGFEKCKFLMCGFRAGSEMDQVNPREADLINPGEMEHVNPSEVDLKIQGKLI